MPVIAICMPRRNAPLGAQDLLSIVSWLMR